MAISLALAKHHHNPPKRRHDPLRYFTLMGVLQNEGLVLSELSNKKLKKPKLKKQDAKIDVFCNKRVIASQSSVAKLPKDYEISYVSTLLDALADLTKDSPKFRKTILLFHTLFMNSKFLIDSLTTAFNVPVSQYADERVYTAEQLHILSIFEQWIKEFPHHFTDSEEAILLTFFRSAISSLQSTDSEVHRQLTFVQSLLLTRYELEYRTDERKHSAASATFIRKFVGVVDITEIGSRKLAEALTLLHDSTYRNIQHSEFLNRGWAKDDGPETSGNILKFIEVFNTCSYWVASEILRRHATDDRQKMIQKFIKVGLYCARLGNFHGAFFIFGGLNITPVHRLKDDWEALPHKSKVMFEKLRELSGSTSNYANYRRERKRFVGKPQIPHLAVTLKDLTALHDGIPTWNHDTDWKCRRCQYLNENVSQVCQMCHTVPEGDTLLKEQKMNFHKFYKQLDVIDGFMAGQKIPFDFEEDKTVTVSIQKLISSRTLPVEKLNEKSDRIRPRKPKNVRKKSYRKITF